MFNVKYRIDGMPNEITVGPYSAEEAPYQREDIASYEGVLYAIIVPVAQDAAEEIMRAFE